MPDSPSGTPGIFSDEIIPARSDVDDPARGAEATPGARSGTGGSGCGCADIGGTGLAIGCCHCPCGGCGAKGCGVWGWAKCCGVKGACAWGGGAKGCWGA